MDTLSFPASSARNLPIARRLARLDAAMRKPSLRPRAAVNARVRFFVETIRCGVRSDCELNSLGGLVESHGADTLLSERSYNIVFEDGDISNLVVREIVRMADQDPSFEASLIATGHQASLAYWRVRRLEEATA
ncbi:hypothetical protein [Metallibacterium scheffleri]|uniref:Uncharacterized protein n=1 Tax=Metallibacterium scheffleri TaxID=993689 RepID=A0A4S3KMN6_9GAMM|nr:hypothetical protein [Metallibacterium scheffleri]THD10076.1 hypothetical protein B1806_09405 [Metallibacterium scheffleri]